jgi:Cu(I)/Ag(I) efflux system membrane protein CusA/SilA
VSPTSAASNWWPDERRGITELNGEGEVVSAASPWQRYGQNALEVIDNLKAKIERNQRRACPKGVSIQTRL